MGYHGTWPWHSRAYWEGISQQSIITGIATNKPVESLRDHWHFLDLPSTCKNWWTYSNIWVIYPFLPISIYFLWVLGGSINVLLGLLHRWSFTDEASRLGLVLSRRIAPRRFQDLGGPSPSGGQSRDHLPGTLQRILDHWSRDGWFLQRILPMTYNWTSKNMDGTHQQNALNDVKWC